MRNLTESPVGTGFCEVSFMHLPSSCDLEVSHYFLLPPHYMAEHGLWQMLHIHRFLLLVLEA